MDQRPFSAENDVNSMPDTARSPQVGLALPPGGGLLLEQAHLGGEPLELGAEALDAEGESKGSATTDQASGHDRHWEAGAAKRRVRPGTPRPRMKG